MSNIQDNTIFSPSVFQTYLLDKRNGTGVLDQYGGASAAYSLYDLGNRRGSVVETEATYHNPAVRLRRDSDGTHKSFPAGAFTQMQNWANEILPLPTAQESAVNTFTTFTNVSSSGFDTTLTSGVGIAGWLMDGGEGTIVEVAFDLVVNSGSPALRLRPATALTAGEFSERSNEEIFTTSGSKTATLTATGDFGSICFGEANTPSDFEVSNFRITAWNGNAYATTWYDQSGVSVIANTYTSDFSAGVDGWSFTSECAVAGNIDSIGGLDDNLRLTSTATSSAHFTAALGTLPDVGLPFSGTLEYYYPSTNTVVDGVRFGSPSSGDFGTDEGQGSDTWHTLSFSGVSVSANGRIYMRAGGSDVFSDADDVLYIRNIKVEQLDKAHNDATQTTADNQPKVVDAGVLVTDANGNASLSFDGVDDELVVANLVNEFENTDFQVTIMALNFYGGLVSGSVPRLYLRDTAYSYDDLSLISYSNPSLALQTFECAGSAHEVFHDGASVGTGTKAQTAFGPTDFAIGQSAAAYRNTTISAFVFYPSDQSANRSAIEQSLSNTLTTALS
jgi:hypothetical protein